MVSNRITEGVGKKIVDALKEQADIEIQNVVENPVEVDETEITYETSEEDFSQSYDEEVSEDYASPMQFSQPVAVQNDSFASDLDGFEIPTNIAVLKQLINQLPAGVSRPTGAQIIKQTMEALGISMKSVLQEAQQVQESLNNSTKECQTSIMEYKKQITAMEKQAQKYQRQYSALNDIISLFVQTGL